MSDKPPFQVGQRVRVKRGYRWQRWKKTPTGVVCWVQPPDDRFSDWWVGVLRDGSKSGMAGFFGTELEPLPLVDLTLDQTAQSLADAVKAGDTNAALLLADRVMELCGATRT